MVCRILKLKKITNAKSAGGCGVVQFPSGLALFHGRVAPQAYTGGLIVLKGSGRGMEYCTALRAIEAGYV